MTAFWNFGRTLAAATLAACWASAPPVAQAAPQSIVVALPGDFPGLDPSKDTSPLGFNYRLNVFDALTELKRDGLLLRREAKQAIPVAMQDRAGRHHLGIEQRMTREQAMEDATMAIRPIHHRGDGKAPGAMKPLACRAHERLIAGVHSLSALPMHGHVILASFSWPRFVL